MVDTKTGRQYVEDENDVLTFKCSSCGAEVVVDTASATQARCHWCRSILSINSQIENGATPDVILPFKEQKASAQKRINDFVVNKVQIADIVPCSVGVVKACKEQHCVVLFIGKNVEKYIFIQSVVPIDVYKTGKELRSNKPRYKYKICNICHIKITQI